MKIILGSDHGGYNLKNIIIAHLEQQGIEVEDLGCYSEDSCDYPVIAKAVAEKGGAIVIEEKDLDHEKLIAKILQLKEDPAILQDMEAKSLQCAPKDASGMICDNIGEFQKVEK